MSVRVHTQTSKNYYLMAFGGGGGGDVATSGWAQAFETFRTIKVGGTSQNGNGSSVALLGPNGIHYLVAENGGGGTVNCNRTSIGVAGRATDYEQLQNKLQVIRALRASNPARTFELLQSGIDQLNELISAAATLNGFEVEMFVSNEMPLPDNSQLGAMVVQYGQELALLAKSDFRRDGSGGAISVSRG